MAERFLSARPHGPNATVWVRCYRTLSNEIQNHWLICTPPPFFLVSSAPFGSARSRPGREAAKRTLDGEDRSDTMKREGKGGLFQAFPQG